MPIIKKKDGTPTTLNNNNGKFILPITVNTESDGTIKVKLRTNSTGYDFKEGDRTSPTFEKEFSNLKAFISTNLDVPFELVGSGGGFCNLYFYHIDPDGRKESDEEIIILNLD